MPHRTAGAFLLFAAVIFWLAWLLMPDAGTNNTGHILAAVRAPGATGIGQNAVRGLPGVDRRDGNGD
jgi:hypothetical protein